jgi:predicted HD phosphohydrolase
MMQIEGVQLGAQDHDRVGEDFLVDMGFPKSVTQFVRGHVLAKKYLVFK